MWFALLTGSITGVYELHHVVLYHFVWGLAPLVKNSRASLAADFVLSWEEAKSFAKCSAKRLAKLTNVWELSRICSRSFKRSLPFFLKTSAFWPQKLTP